VSESVNTLLSKSKTFLFCLLQQLAESNSFGLLVPTVPIVPTVPTVPTVPEKISRLLFWDGLKE